MALSLNGERWPLVEARTGPPGASSVGRRVGSAAVLPRPLSPCLGSFLAAVTNNTCSVAETSTDVFSYRSGGQKCRVVLSGLESRCGQGWFLLGLPPPSRCRENVSCLSASGGARTPWLAALPCMTAISGLSTLLGLLTDSSPQPSAQGHRTPSSASMTKFPCPLSNLSLPPSFEGPCEHAGPT